ncbi:MAG: class I SAM-dependent methyltransferase [Sphaerochaetaceae bacterium]|nr:class I SAM-dependent methyltransferase [Sphaerochaetaceae bacterium]
MDYLIKDFGKILKKNALMMRRLLLQENTDCMRVYDRNIEELPVSVELFSKYARITDYSEDGLSDELEDLVKDAVRRMCYVQGENVIFHRRAKRSNKEQHELQSTHSVTLEVNEASHRFKVDLTKRIDTGLFLDHYKTRKLVQSISDNKRVLNLFSYTGSFSVYAAAGNAQLVESIDLSKTYTDWAMHNLSINGFQGDKYPCITTDALKYVIDSVRNKKIYDLVIFDPPSFSNSRKMEKDFDVQRDYVRYLKFINNLLEKGGKVIFSTNLSSFHMDPGRLKGFEVKNITKDILAEGFTKKKGTSRTWILEKVSKVKLTKEDYEGKKYFTVRENAKKERVKRMEEIQKNEENDFEKIIANLEASYSESENLSETEEFAINEEKTGSLNKEETEEKYDVDDELVIRWDSSYEPSKSPRFRDRRPSRDGRGYSRDDKSSFDRIERSFTRDDRDRRGSRDRGSRSFSREGRDRRPSRDGDRPYNRDRSFNRDDRDRRPSRDGGDRPYNRDRSFNRDDRDRRLSRDNRDRSFKRDDRDRRPSRDRSFNRDDRERRPARDGGFSRNRNSQSEGYTPREKRVKSSKPKPYGFEKKNKQRNEEDF